MNRLLLSLLAAILAFPAAAQLNGDGYYRVKNFESGRYILMVDNKSTGFDYNNTIYDTDALMSIKYFTNVVSDPGSVIYVQSMGNNQYNLKAQGTDAHTSVGRYLTIKQASASMGTYFASATEQGITLYLYDEKSKALTEGRLSTDSGTGGKNDVYRHWYLQPVSSTSSDNYFGLTPSVTVAGQRYTTFYASFPFSFTSSGMKAYAVTKVDQDVAVWEEVSGSVAASTPVIVACAGAEPADNRLNLLASDVTKPAANVLSGVYFNNAWTEFIDGDENNFHFNARKYDPATMRVLGQTSQGKLGFVKSDIKYLPQNSAYLVVAADAPAEITLVTPAEYQQILATDVVTVTARSYSRTYGTENPVYEYDVEGPINGTPTISCVATQQSSIGAYAIIVGKGTCTNRSFTGVPGTLVVTKAALAASVGDYTREEGQPNPEFAIQYSGFLNGDTTDDLTKLPTVACEADEDSAPGVYPITLSGGEAMNYTFTYTAGQLTVTAKPTPNAIGTVSLSASAPADVYSLSGVRVRANATSLQGLPAGIYLVQGRKIVVR